MKNLVNKTLMATKEEKMATIKSIVVIIIMASWYSLGRISVIWVPLALVTVHVTKGNIMLGLILTNTCFP